MTIAPESPTHQFHNPTRRRNWLWVLTSLNCILLAVLWIAETFVAERFWLSTAILYFPQHWIGVPGVLLSMWAALRRHKKALGINVLALGFFGFYFLGFNIPLRARSTLDGKPIRIMTYNIHYGSAGAEQIVDVVRQHQPDILCLQETRALGPWPDPVPEMQRLLKGWHMARGAEVATFSRYAIVAQRAHAMPKPNTRVVLETVIDVGGQHLSVFNTHISTAGGFHRGKRPPTSRWIFTPSYVKGTADVRIQQLPVLLEAASKATATTIICGDLNNPPRGYFYRRLTRKYVDAFAATGWGMGYTFRSDLPVMRIDYILAGQGVTVNSCHVPHVSASDHRPVVADISLPRH